MECHLPYGITQCYLLPDTSEHTPTMQVGTWFTYPKGMEGWVDLVDLIAPRPGVKPAPFDHESNAQPMQPPRHQDGGIAKAVRSEVAGLLECCLLFNS